MTLKKIISGGQTGADQAAFDAAINLGIPHGGWIPKSRRTEVGTLPGKYKLKEGPSSSFPESIEQNVIDSDGTLVISHGETTGEYLLTFKFAEHHKKKLLHIDLKNSKGFKAAQLVKSWIALNDIKVLNVSGPCESDDPNIYEDTVSLLKAVNCLFCLDCCESSFI
jgi:hypothetical protein